jgi:NACalpha-BTF3-like transcription factor
MTIDQSEIDRINDWLRRTYGIFPGTDDACWRVAWSEQFEKRLGTFRDFTESGIFIREVTEVRECRKYSHIKDRYILERLTPIDENPELGGQKLSYECLWTFRDKFGFALMPQIGACWYIIEAVCSAENKYFGKKYKDPREDLRDYKEIKEADVQLIYEQLFGNETPVTTALSQQRAVTVPENFQTTKLEI